MTPVRHPRCVVAIGASAGGLAALERLFRQLPGDTGDAYVVVQHLPPNFKSVMSELLSGFASIPATLAEDDMLLAPNRIYLIPPGKDLELTGLHLRVIQRSAQQALHLPIDRFFSSLARQIGPAAVGIVLSGSGTDGSRGIIDIHRAGGRVFVQSPDSAAFDGMPKAAARACGAAVVGTPDEIAEALIRPVEASMTWTSDWPDTAREQTLWLPSDAGEYAPIFEQLIQRFDLDFSEYKSGTISRRIERRLKTHECSSIDEYVKILRSDEDEVDALWDDLLIGVTRFFRDDEAFELLASKVVPMLLASMTRELRVWVPGCATGEEAFSLAILLDEASQLADQDLSFRIFATDVHRKALQWASAGYYSNDALEGISPTRMARYFEPRGEGYVINSDLRRRVVFAEHNLLSDPPFTRMDLVSCRNVLIYLTPDAQSRVLKRFEFSLRPNGVLVLGPSESLAPENDGFEVVESSWRVFKRKAADSRGAELPASGRGRRLPRQIERSERTVLVAPYPRRDADYALSRVLERYAPIGFLVDQHRVVLHIFGDVTRYLEVGGPVSLDVVTLIKPYLRLPITTAIHRAVKEYRSSTVRTHDPATGESLTVVVDCLHEAKDSPALLFVRLLPVESATPPKIEAPSDELADIAAQRIQDLEEELSETSVNLQSVVEELETSNEELQATNEELLASNEELQSTNEELQSVNEELHTVNAEHERKNETLVELTTDLTMLMECTSIGMVFLGSRLEIRKFTPAIDSVFPLREQDIGRPLSDITHHLADPHRDLISRAAEVFRSGELRELEVMTETGLPLLERIHAHRGPRGDIRGVAVSYVDLSSVKKAEEALRKSEALNRSVLNALAANVAVIDRGGNIIAVNGRWTVFAKANEGSGSALGTGANYMATCLQAADSPDHEDAHRALVGIQSVLSGRVESFEYVYPCHSPKDQRWFLMRVTPLDEGNRGAVIAHIDVTELERLRQESLTTAMELQRMGAAVTAAADGIFVCDGEGLITYVNPSFERMVGHSRTLATGRSLFSFGKGDAESAMRSMAWSQIKAGRRWTGEVELETASGDPLQVEMTLSPIHAPGSGELDQVVGVQRDVGEQRALERQVRHSQKMEAIGTLAGGIAHDFNNLLVAIIGYAYLLNDAVKDNPGAASDLRQIERASSRARDLIDQILTFSRTSPGTVKRVQFQQIVDECLALLRGSIPSSIEMRAHLDEAGGWVEADPTQLHQVVMNLATNAYQAIGEDGGRIEVNLETLRTDPATGQATKPAVVLTVRDNGPGIEESIKDRLFEPFFTTKAEGTGMGLSVVHGIVTRLGGRIEIESELQKGATIRVTLPATEPPDEPVEADSSPHEPGSGRVWVVDDEPALVALMKRMLEPLGYDVETFTSGRQLLEQLSRDDVPRPDLMLVDHAMPRMTGVKLLSETRRLGVPCPAILVSGAAPTFDDSDFVTVLRKPFTRDLLVASVRSALGDQREISEATA